MSLLTRIQSNPEISTNNAAFVSELIDRAKRFVCSFCSLPTFPELAKGYCVSGSTPSTNLSALSSNSFLISVNCGNFVEVNLDLSVCTTGANIATELQSEINACSQYGFDEVTVTYSNSLYTITSGRFGYSSKINVVFNETSQHVCKALKLSPVYGGTEFTGAEDNLALQDAVVMLVEQMYRKIGLEGLSSGSIPGGVSFSTLAEDSQIQGILLANRKFR